MKLTVSEEAANWYKEALHIDNGSKVRFFVRYGGCSTVQKGFSLGVKSDDPLKIGASDEQNGITFFIEDEDLWFFDEHDVSVTLDEQGEEPLFHYNK
ncbi:MULTISPECIES: HesB/YadR/YfhF family protein [Priestia]|uniref:Core domain-containing protein n=1 Tax=Priestia filamentosa TaxID=1402861 RepID=A0A1X7DAY5_9BACI|nr:MULTISPECIES: HesB/YadR/YfhF family protein [Priestia]AKO93636.1 hypothetical protein BEH_17065 [Priestia filamentosa]MCY8232181.1 HesB/YadR/YfhF family protein [Priestia endophytica]MDT3763850.1 HesB/YadR/YfhF family protein [Priestia filamentosa]MED3725871.1 HesB/YadR/YfhF family protein [Priestia filamentosa]OXS71667.1 hypothetical protein B1B01_04950 [Priestia filamentosa]